MVATFATELERLRYFLRDPEGLIWTDADIRTYYNDSLMEMALKVGYLEKVHNYKYPPEWSWSYMRDWEYDYTEGDKYQCLIVWQARDSTVCYPWEAGYYLENSDTPDDGTRLTHPWECGYASPADIVPLPLHAKFLTGKYVAYDERELVPQDRSEIARRDSHYRTASGTPCAYWRPDQETNTFVLYPRPSAITWDDGGLMREPTEALADDGGLNTWDEAHTDETDKGIITNSIATEGHLFMVFEAVPATVEEWGSEIDFPEFLLKYVRYATLERCFGADNDGFVPSLRDFWKVRKEVGIRAIKKFRVLRLQDRSFRLGGGQSKWVSKHPRLPAEYPRQVM